LYQNKKQMMRELTYGMVFLFSAVSLTGQTVRHEEMLGRPTDKSVTIQPIFSDAAEVAFQYGLSAETYTSQTPWKIYKAEEPVEIILDNLLPDSKYYYRVIHRKPGENSMMYRK